MPFDIHRGTNISHWLSQTKQCMERLDTFFTPDDVKRIADWGFDHIRIPIDEENLWDEAGNPVARTFDALDASLDWCEAAGLKAIVDLHITRSHYFLEEGPLLFREPAALEQFCDLWRQLSARLSGRAHDHVAYELLNEPKGPKPDDWNRVSGAAIKAIRERESQRTIFLGSNWFNTPDTFGDLAVPDDDQLWLSFHFYSPILISHHQAPWCKPACEYTGPIHYPGQPIADSDFAAMPDDWRQTATDGKWNAPFGPEQIHQRLELPLQVARQHNCRLHCGEFGVFKTAPRDIRDRWYTDVVAAFNEHDIAYTNWDYRGSFGLIDAEGVDTGIAALLLR